jgi:processive 1,2-diacylglycerol beta-glucosyltransferase
MRTGTLAILSVSAGTGHLRAAEALKATAERMYPGLKAVHVDVMTLVPPLFRKLYADSYLPLVQQHPALWGYLYERSDRRILDSKLDRLRIAIERLNTQKLKSALHEINPDHVVCTHFLPAELFSRWRRKGTFRKPVWVVVTDFDVHMLWVHRHLSGYCTPHEEVAWRLRDRGVQEQGIHVTGIPIMPAFGEPLSRKVCARELGIDPRTMTFLLMSGGAGIGRAQKLAKRLLSVPGDFHVIAAAGRNSRLLADLQRLSRDHPGRCTAMGYTTTIERVMAAADLAITKSGGLTTAECLASGLPMLVVSPIPGQEERNADFLLEHGAGLKAYDEGGLEFRLRMLLADRAKLHVMRENALRLGRPAAAERILDLVLQSS